MEEKAGPGEDAGEAGGWGTGNSPRGGAGISAPPPAPHPPCVSHSLEESINRWGLQLVHLQRGVLNYASQI